MQSGSSLATEVLWFWSKTHPVSCIPRPWPVHTLWIKRVIEYPPASTSMQCGMPIFGWTDAFSPGEKKKKKLRRESQTAVERSFKGLWNMWPPPLARNKTGYLGLRNYSLDMLLLLHTKSLWNTIRIPKKKTAHNRVWTATIWTPTPWDSSLSLSLCLWDRHINSLNGRTSKTFRNPLSRLFWYAACRILWLSVVCLYTDEEAPAVTIFHVKVINLQN